jgi:hypothetical protein
MIGVLRNGVLWGFLGGGEYFQNVNRAVFGIVLGRGSCERRYSRGIRDFLENNFPDSNWGLGLSSSIKFL